MRAMCRYISEAVQSSQTGSFVFVVKPDSTVEMRPVVVSRASAEETVIAETATSRPSAMRFIKTPKVRLRPDTTEA